MFEYDQEAFRHTRATSLNRPLQHRHEIDTADPTAKLDAEEWSALGAFLDTLPTDVFACRTGSLYDAYKLQTSVRSFVDDLISAGFYCRK